MANVNVNQAAQDFDNYLRDIIRITDAETRAAINDQGLRLFADFLPLTEEDVEELCANVRKPGGTIPNPNANVQNQPATIPNPGHSLGLMYEKRLKMLHYYVHHLQRIQRLPVNAPEATVDRLRTIYALKPEDETEDDLDMPEAFTRVDTARVVIENLDDYLLRKRSETGVPLAYVVRDFVTLPIPAEDPGFGLPTYVEEMIRRAPHGTPQYETDNQLVWNVVRQITHGGPAWNWVSRFARNSNGRDAYIALKTHYLGNAYQLRIRALADSRIETAFYDGQNRNFTFENYCALLNNAFADIESTGEVVSETRKIRCFLNGLADVRLETAKSQVLATPGLHETFDSAINFVAQYLDQRRSLSTSTGNNKRSRSIANVSGRGTNTGRGGRGGTGRGNSNGGYRRNNDRAPGRGRGQGRGGRTNTSTHVPWEQWRTLTEEQKQEMRNARAILRGQPTNTVSSTTRNSNPPPPVITTSGSSASSGGLVSTGSGSGISGNIGAVMSRRQASNQNN